MDQQRIETGVVQFGSDYPGYFIRGDDCFAYALYLESALNNLPDNNDFDLMVAKINIAALIGMLRSSNCFLVDEKKYACQFLKTYDECVIKTEPEQFKNYGENI